MARNRTRPYDGSRARRGTSSPERSPYAARRGGARFEPERSTARPRTTRGHRTSGSTRSAQSMRATASRSSRAHRTRAHGSDPSQGRSYRAVAGGRLNERGAQTSARARSTRQARGARVSSVRVGDINKAERNERVRKTYNRLMRRVLAVLVAVVVLAIGWGVLYNSNAFAIEDVQVKGVSHLTSAEMMQLADVPEDTTLLRVDTDTIRSRLMQNAWVKDVSITRSFPHTLTINVTERSIKAIVEIPGENQKNVKQWAISQDHIWLMPIPSRDSEAGQNTSEQIYEDADAALHITDVPYGSSATIGTTCNDDNVNNALDIVSGLTTSLADQVVSVSAAGPEETTLVLDSGVEIAFGKAESIRDKERVALQILEDNPDSVSYINVRNPKKPTWRAT